MPISVTCDKCGKTLKVGDALAGKRVKCPGCGATVTVGAADSGGTGKFDPFELMAPSSPSTSRGPAASTGASASGGAEGRCKNCGRPMKAGTVLCLNCGYNAATGQRMQTNMGPASGGGFGSGFGSGGGSGGGGASPAISPKLVMLACVLVVAAIAAYFAMSDKKPDAVVPATPKPTEVTTTPTEPTPAEPAAQPTPQVAAGPTEEELRIQRELEEAKRKEEARLAELKRLADEKAAKAAAEAAAIAKAAADVKAAHQAKVDAQRKERKDVNLAIEKGVKYLISQYQGNGEFSGKYQKQIGQTALIVFSLLKSGANEQETCVSESIPAMLAYGLNRPGTDGRGTYNAGLVMMAMDLIRERAEAQIADHSLDIKIRREAIANRPKAVAVIRKCVSGLYANQKANQSFSYGGGAAKAGHDMSIHQYALLGMWAAYRSRVVLKPNYWDDQIKYLMAIQKPDGGWAYKPDKNPSRAMTTAGIGSLAICAANTVKKRITRQTVAITNNRGLETKTITDIPPKSPVEKSISHGFEWLAQNNIQVVDAYYLYGLERAAVLTGTTTINNIDWYDAMATQIVAKQNADGSWAGNENLGGSTCTTAWYLLFLRRSSDSYFNDQGEQAVDKQNPPPGEPAEAPPEAAPQTPEPDQKNAPEEPDNHQPEGGGDN
ncbi:MAG: hypothetical protein ACYC26_10300 [Phycisphaerales bacterium]